MPSFIQNDKLAVTFANLGKNDLLLERFSGQERLSGLFQFELGMLAERQTAIPFDKIIGQPVTVRMTGLAGSIRYFNGIISELNEGGLVVGNDGRQTFIRYRAIMVPAAFKLSKRLQSRIFQDTSIKTILQTVFKGFDVDMQAVTESFPPRNYCVQYEESDLAFASRLMEQEGIYYYFKHTENGHPMVFCSGKPTTPALEISYDPAGENKSSERVDVLDKKQQLTSGSFTVWDYHFQAANSNLNATVKVPPPVSVGQISHSFDIGGNRDLEDYQHGDFAHHFDAVTRQGSANSQGLDKLHNKNTNRATLHMERSIAQSLTLYGQSTCPAFAVGGLVEVKNHFRGPIKLLLTEVRHEASLEGAFTVKGNVSPLTYTNQFQSIPADTQYRPQLETPRPRILGCQTAMVVAADNNDLRTDSLGRVQVQFYWDRWGQSSSTLADGNPCPAYQYWNNRRAGSPSSSCWLRVAQAWSGPGFGALFTPRKGMEVVINFVDGDPDRPVIVGCAYNSLNAPPFQLPQDAAASGWKTKTLGGDETNFNGLAFVDTKGKERVYLQSEGNLIIRTEGDLIFDVGGKILTNHSGNQRQTVGNIPGMSGSGGGCGPAPVDVVVESNEALAMPKDSGSTLVWTGSGSGGGGESQAGSFTPWALTGAGAGWANEFQVTWGAVLKTTVGMSGSISIPLKYDIVVDPFTFLGLIPLPTIPFVSPAMSVLADILTGYRKLYFSSTSEFIFGRKNEILLQAKNAWELGGAQKDAAKATIKKTLEIASIVIATLVTVEIGIMGTVSDLVNNETVVDQVDTVCAAAIVGEVIIMEGLLSALCMKSQRVVDVLASATTIASQLAAAKLAATNTANDSAAKFKQEVETIVDPKVALVSREIKDGLTKIQTSDALVFKATSSAKMECNSLPVVLPPTSAYLSLLTASSSMGFASGDPVTSTEVVVSANNVKLSVGPAVPAPTTATITMTTTGITLALGLPGPVGASISMTPQGIEISAPKVSITAPGGLSVTAPTTITPKLGVTGPTTVQGSFGLTGNLNVTGKTTLNGQATTAGPWYFFG